MRIKASPLVLAVALGLLNPGALDTGDAPAQRGRAKQERRSEESDPERVVSVDADGEHPEG
jgi:hypothetical protein